MGWFQSLAGSTARAIGRDSWLVRSLRPAYEGFLNLSPNGIRWEINGVAYRIDPRQRKLMGPNFDAPVADYLRRHVRPGAVCLDVGANVGVYVLQFAHWSGPDGQVIAFEPNPFAREVLERHVSLNGFASRVQIVPDAVGAESGQATLYAAGCAGMSRLGEPNPALRARAVPIPVSVITLDDFWRRSKIEPDWLLIDVEGFEIAALQGAREMIRSRGARLGIVVEMHPNAWASAQTSRCAAESFLKGIDRVAVPLRGQGDPLGNHGIVYLAPRAACSGQLR